MAIVDTFDRAQDATAAFYNPCILDALHLSFTTHSLWHYVVRNFADVLALLHPVWSLGAQCMVTAISDLIIRFLFTRRIWKLSQGNVWLAGLITPLTLLAFGTAFAFGLRGLSLPSFTDVPGIKASWLLILGLSCSVAIDVILAASLCWLLYGNKSGFSKTDGLINLLIVYGISTGAITGVCAILVLITYVTMPDNFIWIAFFFILGKLFLNSLLVSLNARTALKERTALPMSSLSKKSVRKSEHRHGNPVDSRLAVRIDTTSQTFVDDKHDSFPQPLGYTS
ncbi:hypothetical protein PUNSTDRAFT_133841 [Punctularia strigosozonata HHB-11173 SS5]|uniref:uncharacterized protein n=1 Tax=Punctularia strigosozonata (strain HHB-11173) TaxID=741275 RepID=UPI0004416689|nr:uncharacterized protein PUNSTDRAFT_133841 [Punctularia strigosozonata HHB-11173 SS5]EIN10075.1 hypothetical protein PUNSTDRAFT_133841 [Punctularia strigosozonata HHB-11173 SS5]